MKRCLVVAVLLAIALAGIQSPEAAVIKKWSVEPAVRGSFYTTDKDLAVDNDTTFSGSLAFSVLPSFQVELFADELNAESLEIEREDTEFTNEYQGIRLIGTLRAQEDERVLPFVGAGYGKVKTTFDRGGDKVLLEDDSSPYFEFTLGARVFVWKSMNIRGEFSLKQHRSLERTQTNTAFSIYLSAFLFGSKE
jgi:opacity protein-like surface antigen